MLSLDIMFLQSAPMQKVNKYVQHCKYLQVLTTTVQLLHKIVQVQLRYQKYSKLVATGTRSTVLKSMKTVTI